MFSSLRPGQTGNERASTEQTGSGRNLSIRDSRKPGDQARGAEKSAAPTVCKARGSGPEFRPTPLPEPGGPQIQTRNQGAAGLCDWRGRGTGHRKMPAPRFSFKRPPVSPEWGFTALTTSPQSAPVPSPPSTHPPRRTFFPAAPSPASFLVRPRPAWEGPGSRPRGQRACDSPRWVGRARAPPLRCSTRDVAGGAGLRPATSGERERQADPTPQEREGMVRVLSSCRRGFAGRRGGPGAPPAAGLRLCPPPPCFLPLPR